MCYAFGAQLLVPRTLLLQLTWDSDRKHLIVVRTTVQWRDREKGGSQGGEKKEDGERTKRKENLEQRIKFHFSFPPQITSNCSLILAKGKTEGKRRGKLRKWKNMTYGFNCEQHFKVTKLLPNTINTKCFLRLTS